MSKRNRSFMKPTEPEGDDPPESGPPTAAELGQADNDIRESVADVATAIAAPAETITDQVNQAAPAAPAALDCTTIVANLDGRSDPVWPIDLSFKVDWPWRDEIDPVPGDPIHGVVGWNWERREIAVVTAVPPPTAPWPYTLTVEIRPMPEAWRQVKVFDLNSGQRLDVEWYTRWNRAYSQFAKDANGCVLVDESGAEAKRTMGSGWLAVVQE